VTTLHRRLLFVAALSSLAVNECQAQGGGPIAVGRRLRIQATDPSLPSWTGTVVAITNDSLALQLEGSPPRSVTFGVADLRSAQVANGRRRGAWGLRGALIGGVLGAAAMIVAVHSGQESDIPDFDTLIESAVTPSAAVVGLIGGGAIGFGVGALTAPERWEPAYLLPARSTP
jgi:hypothetical protein